jgi:hypothetical protein
MDQLTKCEGCASEISVTALYCPVCGIKRHSQAKESLESGIAKVTLGAAATALMGPAAVVAGIAAVGLAAIGNKGVKNLAKKVGAIDSFAVGDFVVLVTRTEFLYVDTAVGASAFPGIPRHRIEELSIGAKGRMFGGTTPTLFMKYYWPHGERVVSETHKFKGKHASELAELAFAKFNEYRSV